MSKKEQEWPSPAMTHLGLHMKNVHASSTQYVSPLLPQKIHTNEATLAGDQPTTTSTY